MRMRGLWRRLPWIGAAILAAAVLFGAGTSPASARVWVGVGLGFPVYAPPVYYYPPPYYYSPYYYPPPVVYAPPPAVYAPPAPVVQSATSCTNGKWRQQDGSVVNGVACLQPDGTWKLAQ